MLLHARLGIEIRFEEIEREPFADDLRAETADIRVVVLDALMGGMNIVAERGANTRHLVRRHARTDPRTADHDAPLRIPARIAPQSHPAISGKSTSAAV